MPSTTPSLETPPVAHARWLIRPEHFRILGVHTQLWCLYDSENPAFDGRAGKDRTLMPNLIVRVSPAVSIRAILDRASIPADEARIGHTTIIGGAAGRLYLSLAKTPWAM